MPVRLKSRHGISQAKEQAAEGRKTVVQQAFLFTGEISVLWFVTIYAVWFADKMRRNIFG
jgi:hypothetical protein